MLRVLMLTTDLERGGLPMRLVRLAQRLRDVDVEPIVGCLSPRGPLSGCLESAGIEAFSCDARGPHDVACLATLARHVRRNLPDVIHGSLFHANLAARLVGRLDRPRPIITTTVTIEIERRWHRWLEALTADRSDLHVANSMAVAEHLRTDLGFPPDRVVVIPNGLDLGEIDRAQRINRRAWDIENGVPLLVWAGRMDPVKDLQTLVDIIDEVRRRRAVNAVLVGDGSERLRIEQQVGRRRLGSVIRLAPWSDNVPGWLKTADVLVFPSRTEGSPNVVIEAMLCGCPVVASDLPATRELIDHGVHGLLCRPGGVRTFAEAIVELLADDRRRGVMAAAARERAIRRHNIIYVVPRWREAYDRVLAPL
ncbi:MAG: glycosyltransferase [Phycisphaerae bacterium]|nr:glycosyltransferase [Phycisphaerae bacterium]